MGLGAVLIVESKITHGSSWVNQRSNCSGMPYGQQIWSEESLIQCYTVLASKVTQESALIYQRSNCFEIPYAQQMWRMPLSSIQATGTLALIKIRLCMSLSSHAFHGADDA